MGVDQIKTHKIENNQKYIEQIFYKDPLVQFLLHPFKPLIQSENLQGKRHEPRVAENRHLKDPPKVEIGQRILPVGPCEEIP
jgi:hypothetical protein